MSRHSPEDDRPLSASDPLGEQSGSTLDETGRVESTRAISPPELDASSPAARMKQPVPNQPGHAHPSRGPSRSARMGHSAAPPPTYPGPGPQGAPRRPAQRRRPSDSGWYLPWWSLVIMVGMVGGIALGLLVFVAKLSQPQSLGNQTPHVELITSQPTLSQDFYATSPPVIVQPQANPAAIPQAIATPTVPLPTPVPSPSLPPGNFAIGASAQVVGVEASGLNVRSTPGYGGVPRFLAYDGEVFVLVDGPQSADDLEWWRIEDPDDPDRFGWAARNFLMIVAP